MVTDDCIFCKIANGEIPCHKVYEDDEVLAFLDVGPVSTGHTLVIPKAHFNTFDQCPGGVLAKISACAGKIAGAVAEATDAEGYNVLCNNGRAAGQLVEHVHFHIIPRTSGDRMLSGCPAGEYEQGRAEQVAQQIRQKLEDRAKIS